jgi:hypothetical protein
MARRIGLATDADYPLTQRLTPPRRAGRYSASGFDLAGPDRSPGIFLIALTPIHSGSHLIHMESQTIGTPVPALKTSTGQ